MNPIVIGVFIALVLVVGSWYLKAEHNARKIKIIVLIVILLIVYLSIVNVFSSGKVDLSSPKGIVNGVYVYIGWIGKTVSGLWDVGSDTTGRVIDTVKLGNESSTKIKK